MLCISNVSQFAIFCNILIVFLFSLIPVFRASFNPFILFISVVTCLAYLYSLYIRCQLRSTLQSPFMYLFSIYVYDIAFYAFLHSFVSIIATFPPFMFLCSIIFHLSPRCSVITFPHCAISSINDSPFCVFPVFSHHVFPHYSVNVYSYSVLFLVKM